jgi:hypothetical protein
LTAVLNTRKITTFIHFVAKYWMYVKRKKIMEQELFTINKCKIIRKISYGISVILKILHHLLHTMIDFITQKFVFSQKFYEFDNLIKFNYVILTLSFVNSQLFEGIFVKEGIFYKLIDFLLNLFHFAKKILKTICSLSFIFAINSLFII